MDPEKKEDPNEFGKVIDALHNKNKLSSLRTYQGDVAEFMKEKNESVISVVVKEKKREQEQEQEKEEISTNLASDLTSTLGQVGEITIQKEEKEKRPEAFPKQNKDGFQINFTVAILSLLLVAGGSLAVFYVYKTIKEPPVKEVVLEEQIIPYNNLVTLANVTGATLGSELGKLTFSSRVNIIKISDTGGTSIKTSKEFFNFVGVSLPASLARTLQNEHAVGVFSQNKENSYFLIIKASDFGTAFSAMLDWEGTMVKDLSFLNVETNINIVAVIPDNTASSTASTTPITTIIPMKPEVFSWKDMIIKNKDTRGFVNEKGKSKIAYTFLDKNTILITNNISVIGDISSIYASRSVVR